MFKLNHFSYSLGFLVLSWTWSFGLGISDFLKNRLLIALSSFPVLLAQCPALTKQNKKKCYIFKAPLLLSGSEINIGQNI